MAQPHPHPDRSVISILLGKALPQSQISTTGVPPTACQPSGAPSTSTALHTRTRYSTHSTSTSEPRARAAPSSLTTSTCPRVPSRTRRRHQATSGAAVEAVDWNWTIARALWDEDAANPHRQRPLGKYATVPPTYQRALSALRPGDVPWSWASAAETSRLSGLTPM